VAPRTEGPDLEEPRWLSLGQHELPYLEIGDPSGRPVVLVPGLTDGIAPVTEPETRAMLADVPLPMVRYRGLVLSHRFPADAALTTRDLAADLALALDELLDGPAVLVCHSMGGMVAQHLAADRSDLVAAMILSATAAHATPRLRRVVATWAAMIEAGDAAAFAAAAVAASFTGRERERRAALVAAAPPPPLAPDAIRRHLALSAACATHDARGRLGAVRCAALVLAGELDPIAPPEDGQALAAGLHDAEFEVVPGTSHGFPEQEPERFAARALRFLEVHA
jgi:3-oxoadipate enol-lactonase